MDIQKADIWNLKESVIDSDVRFEAMYWPLREIMTFRRENFTTTQMCWITLRPAIDSGYTLYNPHALIFNILN